MEMLALPFRPAVSVGPQLISPQVSLPRQKLIKYARLLGRNWLPENLRNPTTKIRYFRNPSRSGIKPHSGRLPIDFSDSNFSHFKQFVSR
jgi:hypothetical protein